MDRAVEARMPATADPSICVLIPCLDEQETVAAVIADFRRQFPHARTLVVDNGSTDATRERARDAGAQVLVERHRGKATAVLSALRHVDEDVVLLVDGDGTYPADGAGRLLAAYLAEPSDMITGTRTADAAAPSPFPRFHRAGTSLFAAAIGRVFGYRPADIFSGLRLLARRFYKNVPINSRGFELEMELVIQAIDKGFTMAEVDVPYRDRPLGSESKLRTLRDGFRILRLLVVLFRDYRPMRFFGWFGTAGMTIGILAGIPPIYEYFTVGLIGRFPLAILAASVCTLSILTFFIGLLLESQLRQSREAYQVALRRFDESQKQS
jgi:glycosyltransferase involved in cell wall biosynthesis